MTLPFGVKMYPVSPMNRSIDRREVDHCFDFDCFFFRDVLMLMDSIFVSFVNTNSM